MVAVAVAVAVVEAEMIAHYSSAQTIDPIAALAAA